MYQTLHCIALRTGRYSDSKNILSAWSRELGRVALVLPAGASREARRRRALTVPLAAFEGECDVRPGRDLLTVRDFRPADVSIALKSDPYKSLTAVFLAEVLDLMLSRADADETLSDYLFSAIRVLASTTHPTAVANFHLVFLFHLAAPLGIAPDTSEWSPGMVFDMRDAMLRHTPPPHSDYLGPADTEGLSRLPRITFANMHRWLLSSADRGIILNHILRYYGIHMAPLTSLHSLDILRSLNC